MKEKIDKLSVTKMHGCGNSYGIIKDLEKKLESEIGYPLLARSISSSIYGLSTDGILVVNKGGKTDYRMRIFNPDGSEAEMCGNGVRLFARYLYDNKFVSVKEFPIETYNGSIIVKPRLKIKDGKVKSIEVEMGKGKILGEKTLKFGEEIKGTCVSVGNPHFIIFSDKASQEMCKKYGSLIENHKEFIPQRTNVEFAKILNPSEIEIHVWERGVGYTLACGTGASATAFLAYKKGKTKNKVNAKFPGGILKISIDKDDNIILEGPAEYCFKAEVYLAELLRQ